MKNTFTLNSVLLGSLSLAALSVTFTAPAQAVVLIGNLPQTNDSSTTTLSSSSNVKALGFTLPSGIDYSLDNVVLRLGTYDPADTLTVQIRNSAGSTPGASVLASFINPVGLGTANQNYTFTPSSPFTFAAGTKYWLFVQGGTGTVQWRASNPAISPTGIITNFNLADSQASNNGGTSFVGSGTLNSFQINATPVPLESDALPVVGSALFMAGGLWWKKKRAQTKVAEFVAKQ